MGAAWDGGNGKSGVVGTAQSSAMPDTLATRSDFFVSDMRLTRKSSVERPTATTSLIVTLSFYDNYANKYAIN